MGASTIDTLRHRVGTVFHIDEGGIDVELTEIAELRPNSFSVVFEGPAEPVLSQATYTFRADDVSLLIFVVPIGPRDTGAMGYEAVFTSVSPS
jgi:hypothetical protein